MDTKNKEGEYCQICDTFVEGFEYQGCCDGRECGCMGMPVEPCICSNKCWDMLMAKTGKIISEAPVVKTTYEVEYVDAHSGRIVSICFEDSTDVLVALQAFYNEYEDNFSHISTFKIKELEGIEESITELEAKVKELKNQLQMEQLRIFNPLEELTQPKDKN